MSRAGYVLVGGQSSRMGRDKALLPFHGGALGASVAHQVALATGSAVLVGNPRRYGGLGYPILPDVYPGEGPLGGILSVLQNTRSDWNLIVACDMPAITGALLSVLLEAAEDCHQCDALIPAGPSGRLEPLCAVYHSRTRQPLYAAFERGIRKISKALEEVRTVVYPIGEAAPFQNVNTPEDWADYASKPHA